MNSTRLRVPAVLTGLALLAGSLLVPTAAHAAEGAPPESGTRQAIAGVHTDAVSTFFDDGKLVLGTKADLDRLGQRLDPASSFVNIEEAARTTVPPVPAYAFLGEPGADLWLASEVQQQGVVWPGFSTESVPTGTFDGNTVEVALTSWEGPGELEVWDGSGAFGAPGRMFSTREGSGVANAYRLSVPQHKHANWGFSAAGTYSLTFTASASVGGTPQTATQAYTFVVGDVPAAEATATELSIDDAGIVLGDTVTATATVSPADANGWVEFRDGATSLGHGEVADGRVTHAIEGLGLGSHSLTASFTPRWTNDFTASASAPAAVTVTEDDGGDVFSIRGIAPSYASGDILTARVVGITPAADEVIRWIIAPDDDLDRGYYLSGDDDAIVASPTLERELTTSYDGHSIQAILTKADKYSALQETAFVPLAVSGPDTGTGVPIDISGLGESYHVGDVAEVSTQAQLGEGQSFHWVMRNARSSVAWVDAFTPPQGNNPFLLTPSEFTGTEFALQVRDEQGAVLGQSAPRTTEILQREVQFSGLQTVYRAGDTLTVTADIYPAVEGATYSWSTAGADYELIPIEGQTSLTLTLPVTADMDGEQIYFSAQEPRVGASIAFELLTVKVTDSAAGEQVIYFDELAGHYHQGSTIRLRLASDPAVADSDSFRWSWKRPDQADFVPLDVTGDTYEVRAQQALDGTQVRAELLDAAGDVVATAEPVTIHVDDHGAPPMEKAGISGIQQQYRLGDDIALSATVAPASVLTRWEWLVQKDGESAPSVIADENGPELTLPASDQLDGAAVFARLTFEDGTRYVEAAPVLITIEGHDASVPATEVAIESDRDPEDYWSGQTATLTATQSVATGLTEYRWLVKAPDAADFTVVAGKESDTYTFKPNPSNSGTQVKVQLIHDGGVHAESPAVTFRAGIKDPVTEISVTGDKAEYTAGDIAHFVSAQQPQTDHEHYHWYIKRPGASEYVWVDQSRSSDLRLPVTAEDDGSQLIIRLFDADHATIAESAPVTIQVAEIGEEPTIETDLAVTADAEAYDVGATATFTSVQSPDTGLGHYHWFIKRAGDADYSVVPGAFEAVLRHTVAQNDEGALVVAKLYDDDHRVVAASEPVAIRLVEARPGDPDSGAGQTEPEAAPASRTPDSLGDSVSGGITLSVRSVTAGSAVTVGIGAENAGSWNAAWLFSEPTLLTGDWVQANALGEFAVTVPADTAAGDHRVAVFDSSGELIGWETLTVTAAVAPGTVDVGDLAATGGSSVLPTVTIALLLLAGGMVIAMRTRARRIEL